MPLNIVAGAVFQNDFPRAILALGGKTPWVSRAEGHPPYHVPRAWCAINRMVLGQLAVDKESIVITLVPEGRMVIVDFAGHFYCVRFQILWTAPVLQEHDRRWVQCLGHMVPTAS